MTRYKIVARFLKTSIYCLETCIENLFQAACSPPSSHGSMAHSGMATTSGDNDLSLNGALSADKSAKVSSVSAPKATRKTHVDAGTSLFFCDF